VTRLNVIASADLRPLKDLIRQHSGNGTRIAYVSGPAEFDRSLKALAGKPVQLYLPGPFPAAAKGYPGSILKLDLGPNSAVSGDPADLLAAAIETLPATGTKEVLAADERWLAEWRDIQPDPAFDGRPEANSEFTGAGQILRAALSGKNDGKSALDPLSTARFVRSSVLWIGPYDGSLISADEALEIAGLIQSHHRMNDRPGFSIGAQPWNHATIKAAFSGKGGTVAFFKSPDEAVRAAAAAGGQILSWAGRTTQELADTCREHNIPLIRVEDGFLRSVGLGAGTARGASLAADDLGIYYDPAVPSRLEVLMETRELTEAEIKRGRRLRKALAAARVSKYNFGRTTSYDFPSSRELLLVPGQVADDAAIRRSLSKTIDCANTPNVNLDLLKQARQRNPDAFLIYKPHPDVETGLRKGKLSVEELEDLADFVARDADIIDLIERVDRVETFSSLSGFEALIRDVPVTVHGLPFYAGWGMSDELTQSPRRTRRRTIDEAVFLAMVVYTRTIDPVTLLPCSPETLINRLIDQRRDVRHRLKTDALRHLSWLGRKLGI